MSDRTYNQDEINAVPAWKLAFELSEVDNDTAPIGWSNYIPQAKHLLNKYYMDEKKTGYQFSDEKCACFKFTAQHFETLLTGDIVKVTKNSGDIPIEFFFDDIGIAQMEHIFHQQMSKLRNKLRD